MNITDLKIFFAGTPFFAKEILRHLLKKNVPIQLIITQPDRLQNRKKKTIFSEVKKLAIENKLAIFQPAKFDVSAIVKIKKAKPDLLIVASYGMILSQELLNIPRFGCVNVHPSLLPKFRGVSPIQTALLKNEKITGTTIMSMNEKMDAGDILAQRELSIDRNDDYFSLEKKLIKLSNELLLSTIEKIVQQKVTAQKQDDQKASYTQIIKKSAGEIDWQNSAQKIFNQYRAFVNWPETFSFFHQKKIIFKQMTLLENEIAENKINKAIISQKKAGEVFVIESENKKEKYVAIKTGKGIILPEIVQLAGKQALKIQDFINGRQNFIGTILGN